MTRSPRILICRLSAIGDCILTMPMLCAVRRHYPDSYIAWVVQRNAAVLLHNHPCLDEVIEVEKGFLKSPARTLQLRRRLRERRFDIAIDPQSLLKSSLCGWLSGARVRIGNDGELGREGSRWLNNRLTPQRFPHVIDRQRDLLSGLDVRLGEVEFQVPRDASAEAEAESLLAERGLREFAVINPGAGWDSRIWPAERYGEVALRLGRDGLRSLVVWAGDRERSWAERIVADSGGHAELAPATSLPEMASLLRRARLFVGSDTGPLHLAVAVGALCVALHGPTLPKESGPYGSQHAVVQAYYQAGGHRQRRQSGNGAMRAITASQVVDACRNVLFRAAPRNDAA